MPLAPNAMERVVLGTGIGPTPLLDLFGALGCRVIGAALRLGLFEALRRGPLRAEELAQRTGADLRGLLLLLEALEPLGYVRRGADGRCRNAPAARRWLLAGEGGGIPEIFDYFEDVLERWAYLEETLRQGRPPLTAVQWLDRRPGGWERYHAGLRAVARLLAPEIVARVELPAGARRLLDLGGGHGLYGARFCRRHPRLAAEVLDWPQARAVAEETIDAEGVAGRVRFVPGDLRGEIPAGQDVVLLFSVLRVFTAQEAQDLVRRTAAALRPGGIAVVMDHFRRPAASRVQRASAALIALELYNSTAGTVHAARDVAAWLRDSGLGRVRRITLRRSPGLFLLVATRP